MLLNEMIMANSWDNQRIIMGHTGIILGYGIITSGKHTKSY